MDALARSETRFLPALAEEIARWFPELQGRSLAVSEVTVTKENVPTLPLVMVAFVSSTSEAPARSSSDQFQIVDTFVVDFWLEPARYKRADGSETPFWSYYDYEAIRDKLLSNLTRWESPGGERIAYRGLAIDADHIAVTLTFTFVATFRWCATIEDVGERFDVTVNLCTPVGCVP